MKWKLAVSGALMAGLGLLMVLGLGWRSRRAGLRNCRETVEA